MHPHCSEWHFGVPTCVKNRPDTAIKLGKGLTRNVAIKRQGTISERSGGGRSCITLT